MIDPSLFTVESLLKALLDDSFGNVDAWRRCAEIVPKYMPPFPRSDTKPICAVRCGESFLRYSAGPAQGFFWDLYGEDFGTPALALLGLCQAPPPPFLVRMDVVKHIEKTRRFEQALEKAGLVVPEDR
jgi:hypothetical protein